ncbi:SixA phosphatase family protein [Polaribacter porphyrae]|uniref:Phosphoglycerate mutase n=1 Tax=Polaribacter porphyrae TaxID=1137780 RepID=A0A2S7WL92_9FLAO|nr:phosphoglycerate mutase family protein [Polaribacter porphyrae]PQJ78375.1 phosphoglycerate mutase [Polaribacter porphyrae]
MKKYFLLLVFTFTLLSACSSDDTTVYYLIRHAEKDRTDPTNRNPNLNFEGEKRAQRWAEYFKDIHLDAVYSTQYNRTIETATPTAQTKKIKLEKYNPRNMYDSVFQSETKGKSVLIVGHSNTTPAFTNLILGEKKYQNMDDNDNASLYMVTISGDKKTSEVLKVD